MDCVSRIDESMIGRRVTDVVDDFLASNINYCKSWLLDHMSLDELRNWVDNINRHQSMFTSGMDISFEEGFNAGNPDEGLVGGGNNDQQQLEEGEEILLKESYAEMTKRGRNSVTSELFQDIVGGNSKQSRSSITMSRGKLFI